MSGAQSNVVSVSYDFDEEKLSLFLTTYGDNSAKWKINSDMGSISRNNNNFSDMDKADGVELLTGVTEFHVQCLEYDSANHNFKQMDDDAVYSNGKLPDVVQITLKLVDQTALKRIQGVLDPDTDLTLSNIEGNEVAKRLLDENIRTFTRLIPVDRGTF